MIARLACFLTCLAALSAHPQPTAADDDAPYATVAVPQAAPEPERTGDDEIAAARLFGEGRGLIKQSKFSEACAVFERSRQLNTTVAVLLNLGLCHQKSGRIASAHLYYRRAEVLATLNGDQRGELAHQEASNLSKLRATVTLDMSETSDAVEVRIDGALQASESWSRPMFIDAGEHVVTIQAPDKLSWQGALLVQDGAQHVVVVPALRRVERALPEPRATPRPAPPAALEPALDAGPGTLDLVALGVGGAGVISLGAGLLFGLAAQNAFADSRDYCDARDHCLARGLTLRADADAHATRATVLSAVGGLALAGGVILWLAAPSAERQRVHAQLARRNGGTP
jgi:hypothetical protein